MFVWCFFNNLVNKLGKNLLSIQSKYRTKDLVNSNNYRYSLLMQILRIIHFFQKQKL